MTTMPKRDDYQMPDREPLVTGAIVLGALVVLIAIRRGFRGYGGAG